VRGERVADARAPFAAVCYVMSRIAQPAEWFAAATKSPEVDAKPERRPLSGGLFDSVEKIK
jgi:hypothetical protein